MQKARARTSARPAKADGQVRTLRLAKGRSHPIRRYRPHRTTSANGEPVGPFPAENPDGLPDSVAARFIGREERSSSRGPVFGESATTELKIVISKARLKAHRFREVAQLAVRLRMVE
jgi:hypothetical protein